MFISFLKKLLIFITLWLVKSIINYHITSIINNYKMVADNKEFSIKNSYYQFHKEDCGIFEDYDCSLDKDILEKNLKNRNKNLDDYVNYLHKNYYPLANVIDIGKPSFSGRCVLINKLYDNSCFIYFGRENFQKNTFYALITHGFNTTVIVNVKSSQLLDTGTKTNLYSRKYIRDLGLESDDAGHILGKRLGGYGNLTSKTNTRKYDKIDPRLNLIPQTPSINRGIYRKYEETIYNCIKDYDTQAILEWYIIYENGELNNRPTKIIYSADFKKGCKSMKQEFYNSIEEVEGDVGE